VAAQLPLVKKKDEEEDKEKEIEQRTLKN